MGLNNGVVHFALKSTPHLETPIVILEFTLETVLMLVLNAITLLLKRAIYSPTSTTITCQTEIKDELLTVQTLRLAIIFVTE